MIHWYCRCGLRAVHIVNFIVHVQYKEPFHIFMDGSKCDNLAGAGVYCPKGNFQKSYHIKDKSVFTKDLSTYTSGFTEFTGLNTECNRVIR